MKKNIVFVAVLLIVIFSSFSAIYAEEDIESIDSQINSVNESSDSISQNTYSNIDAQNININNIEESSVIYNSALEKINSNIDAPSIELYYKNGTRFVILLTDENGVGIVNQNITIYLNGNPYVKTTNSSGYADIAINLFPGEYEVIVTYGGSDIYNNASSKSKVIVKETIFGDDVVKYYRNGTEFHATFLDGQGNPLPYADTVFNINGIFYPRTTNDRGMASLNINLYPDKYILTAIHPISGLMKSFIVEVLSNIKSNDLTKAFLDGNQFHATFLDGQGNPLTNADIVFNINGVLYSRTTNDRGMASLNINLYPDTYILTATHPNGLMESFNIKVLTNVATNIVVGDKSVMEGSGETLDISLYDEIGYLLPNQPISVTINGQTYTVTTNDKGVATYTINEKEGKYTVQYEFKGTNTYLSSSKVSNLEVTPKNPSYLYGNDSLVFYNNGESFYVLLQDANGSPIINKTVYITINGKEYARNTDNKGIAKITINLNPGNYIVSYRFEDPNYSSSKGSNLLTVVSSNISNIKGNDAILAQGMGDTFQVILSVDGVPLVNEIVMFTINGKSYERITNENGIASITINLNAGDYNIHYTYKGSSKIGGFSGSNKITVVQLISTSLKNFGSTVFYEGEQSQFYVILTDNQGSPLDGMYVTININQKDYVKVTDSNGIAALNINLGVGTYTISYTFDRTTYYAGSSGSQEIDVLSIDPVSINANSYWVFGSDMKNVNLDQFRSNGIGNIFLNYYAITLYGITGVENWIAEAASYNINVHIWMQAFYDGGWISPVNTDGSYKYDLFNELVAEGLTYANMRGVAGIHLDYLRFPGTAYKYSGVNAINEFTKIFSDAMKSANPDIILSAAVMPETTSNAYYYGQDVSVLGKYLDVIVPMVYKGNYNKGSDWIKTTTAWFVSNSAGAQVWTGLQGYRSDDDVTLLSATELAGDAQAALDGGAKGAAIFRFKVSNIINFNDLNYPSSSGTESGVGESVSIAEIITSASNLKNYIESNGALPSKISISGKDITTSQFLYLMTKAVTSINSGQTAGSITIVSATNPSSSIDEINGLLYKEEYLTLANSISTYVIENKKAPVSVSTSIGNIQYDSLVYIYSKILNHANDNQYQLPASINTQQSDLSGSVGDSISINNILIAASNLKNYISANDELPNSVSIGSKTYSIAQALYLMMLATININNGDLSNIVVVDVDEPSNPQGAVINGYLTKENYLDVATRTVAFMINYDVAPNYASSTLGNIIYSELVDAFSRILTYYKENSAMPTTCQITYQGASAKSISELASSLTAGLTTDLAKATTIFNYVRDNIAYSSYENTKLGAAGTLTAGYGNCCDQTHLLVELAKASGLTARYVHGRCWFYYSQAWIGHVWGEIYVDGTWYTADPTGASNTLGSVSNWNVNTYTYHNTYTTLPF